MEKHYYTTIGLEIHAELSTASKMFCGCKNDPDEERPNVNVCPVCLAHPGTLPVPNKQAIENVIRVGLALGSTIADFSEFDRKNYFYPDIPKGYQISQYKYPIVSGGSLADMSITRIHLEEDTGTSKHDRGNYSLVDFNRAGVPLMELVTDPHTFDSAEEASVAAGKFAREYQLLLQFLHVSDANMEKGEMRVEANISVSTDKAVLSKQRVEVKNLNSVRAAERAIKFEVSRMITLIEAGRVSEIVQETRGWDETKQATFSQRLKENSEDYRYFPDPDIPKYKLSEFFDIEALRNALPELPSAKRARYKDVFGIKDEDIESYVSDRSLGDYFENVVTGLGGDKEKIKTASNYITSDLVGLQKKNPETQLPRPEQLAELINLIAEGTLSSRAAKDLLPELAGLTGAIKDIAEERGLIQKNDEGALKEIAQRLIDENPVVVESYKGGKENAIMSLVGKIIKETNGSANPQVVIKILKELLA